MFFTLLLTSILKNNWSFDESMSISVIVSFIVNDCL